MTLTLSALSLNDQPLTQPVVAHFDPPGGTIGRGDQNTLTLPDPERHISRQHARIHPEGNGWRITNLSAANAVTVAGRTLAQGESAPVRHRDLLRIGGFLLEVRDESAPDENVRTITRGRAQVSRPHPPAQIAAPGDLSEVQRPAPGLCAATTAATDDPFMALFGPALSGAAAPLPPPPAPPAAAPFGASQQDAGPPRQSLRSHGDPVRVPPVPWVNPQISPASSPEDPFAVLDQPLRPGNGAESPPSASPDPFDAWLNPAPTPTPTPTPAPAPTAATALSPSPAAASARPMQSTAPAGSDNLLDEIGRDPQASMADLFSSSGNTELDLDAFLRQPLTPAPGQAAAPLPGATTPPTVPPSLQQAAPDHVSDLQSALQLPAMVIKAAAAPLPTPRPAPGQAPSPASAPHLHPATALEPGPEHTPDPPPVNAAAPRPARGPSRPPAPTAELGRAPDCTDRAAPLSEGAANAADASPEALWRAFCEGSGAQFVPPQGLNPDLMRVIGSLLRASVDGMVQLMAIRAATKHELRAEMTLIQSRNNNPLKFSPDAQSALEQLLQPPLRGFMAGPTAVHDAMHDLIGHTIGTMAGMRAALEGVLQRFQPGALEDKLVTRSVLDTLLPMNRRAKLWELYLQHFESIRGEAQEDFHTLFGKAFVAAYEQQLDRLYEQEHARGRGPAAGQQPPGNPGKGATHRD